MCVTEVKNKRVKLVFPYHPPLSSAFALDGHSLGTYLFMNLFQVSQLAFAIR